MYSKFTRIVCLCMVFSLLVLNVSVPTAKAAMISTESSMSMTQASENRIVAKDALQRADVQQVLTSKGISVAEAEARIDALSNEEVARLAQQVQDMPAGSGALGVVVGAAVLVFIILLITDIAGATDVFPFVNKAK